MSAPVAPRLEELLRPLLRGGLPVRLTAWDGSVAGDPDGPRITLNSPDALRRLLWRPGELGAAQAYVTGELDVEDDIAAALTQVRAVAEERGLAGARPRPADLLRALRGAAGLGALGRPLPPPATRSHLRGRPHTPRRDRAAISHHYDLSNDFYALLLDPAMAYSCAYFTRNAPGTPRDPGYGIAQAQRDKLDLVCRKVGLGRPGMRLLDVGCGWGALSIHAAAEHNAQVVGVTISREQKAFADKRIAELGLGHRIEIRLQDYREIPDGPFDAVTSLEMGEHVGEGNYPRYAQVLHDNAKPGARVLVQQMSRAGKHPGGGPFIESFIAPDMTMRPVGETVALLERAGLEMRDVHSLREHYVWTVDAWLARFEARWSEAVDLVGIEMARVWRLYLVGGRLSFEQGRMGRGPAAGGAAHRRRPVRDAHLARVPYRARRGAVMSGFDWAGLAAVAAASAAALALVQTAAHLVGRRIGRYNVVDVAWGLGFVLVALVAALVGDGDPARAWLLCALVAVWGLRLSWHMHVKSAGRGEDPRYTAMLERAGGAGRATVIRKVFLTQGLAQWLVSMPLQVSAVAGPTTGAWSAAIWLGGALWLLGVVFEAVGDHQLRVFKANPANRGAIMASGLWAWTRHPNYFGDACVWWGLWLIAASAWPGVLTVLSPVVMTYFLVFATGARLLERAMSQRPGYREYQRSTSYFLPRPPRRKP